MIKIIILLLKCMHVNYLRYIRQMINTLNYNNQKRCTGTCKLKKNILRVNYLRFVKY